MNICTVTTRRRIPYATVLAESFLEQHQGTFTALVCDAGADDIYGGPQQSRFLTPADLKLASSEISRMAMTWPEKLLMRALVPDLLEFLIEESSDPALFFADDTFVTGRIDALAARAYDAGLVLALRTASPLPSDGRTPGRSDLLEAGLHDPGFVGAGLRAKDCLHFWRDAVVKESVNEGSHPVVERIQDLLAAQFPAEILREAAFGASFWNLWNREIARTPAGLAIGDSALALFHFESFSPDKSHLLSTAQGPRPRVLLSEREDLRFLTETYCDRLMAAGFEKSAEEPYRFAYLPSGVKVDDRMRRLYRRQLVASLERGGAAPPDPFDPSTGHDFVAWLNSPDNDGPAPKVSRYLYGLYEERGDLRAAFPGIARADAARYLDWVRQYGAEEADLPEELCPRDEPEGVSSQPGMETTQIDLPPGNAPLGGQGLQDADDQATDVLQTAPQRIPFGVNIVGYFKAELGVGEMGRLVLSALRQSQIPYATSVYSAPLSRQTHTYVPAGEEFSFDTNLFCVNADQLTSVIRDYGTSILQDRYNIGIWWWEVDLMPARMAQASDLLDEIWVGSEYVGRAVVRATEKVVRLLPIPIRPINAAPLERSGIGMPEGFMFVCSFDFLSVFERKNPIAVVEAFKQAFSAGEGPSLLIKTINGEDHLDQLEKLRMAACGRPDIKVVDGYLSAEDKDRLIASSDCYVSLHRAEGYGLGMAEAMALGKPIIATAYSGNLAFLNESNSYLIGYNLVPIAAGPGPYPPGAHWADPDIDEAAKVMRRIFSHPEEARELGGKARQDALTIHTFERTAGFISERLDSIRLERTALPPPEMDRLRGP